MTAIECVMATALLVAPPGTPEPIPAPERWPAVQAALHAVAIRWEILDKRETRYVFARLEDFESDLNLLRRRYVELADAPMLHEGDRFPDRATVNDLLTFNRAYRRHLDSRQVLETDRSDLLQGMVRETDRLYQVWDAVRDARCEFYYVTVRRQALKRLRDQLGADAFECAHLPPHVPIWHFQE